MSGKTEVTCQFLNCKFNKGDKEAKKGISGKLPAGKCERASILINHYLCANYEKEDA